ncbi:hypothetical protein Aperf_G00000004078 [Anoplocephala perfoliata]
MATLEDAKITFYHMKHGPETGVIQMILAHMNLTYTDEAIRLDDWLLRREEIITTRVPALRIEHPGGKLEWMTEGTAIIRCLGEQYHLLGNSLMDKYNCDRIIGKIRESVRLMVEYFKYKKFHKGDADEYNEYKDKLFNGIANILQDLDKMLKENNGEYAAANDITIADFYLLDFVDFVRANKSECLQPYVNLTKWRRHLMENDQPVAKFTAGRSWVII